MFKLDIELIQKNKLIVFLNNEDMNNFNITYESISWQDEKSRTILAKLLSLAQIKTGFSINNCNLLIEVIPQFRGCAVLFTKNPIHKDEKTLSKLISKPIIIHTDDVENIMSLCEKSNDCWSEFLNNTLFLISSNYFLLVYPQNEFSLKSLAIFEEYGKCIKANNIIISWLKENTKILCENNATQCIGKYILMNK